jgi:choline kinase
MTDPTWRPTRAVILAAGLGQRLMPLTADRPKAMVTVHDRPLIDRTLDALAGRGCTEVTIVTGYRGDQLASHVGGLGLDMTIRCVPNPRFATSNSMLSLAIGLDATAEGSWVIEGDVVFDPHLLDFPCRHAISWFVDSASRDLPGSHVTSDVRSRANAVTIVRDPREAEVGQHKSVGILAVRPEGAAALSEWLADGVRAGRLNEYYDLILRDHVGSGLIGTVDVAGVPWFEIDTPEERRVAEGLFT